MRVWPRLPFRDLSRPAGRPGPRPEPQKGEGLRRFQHFVPRPAQHRPEEMRAGLQVLQGERVRDVVDLQRRLVVDDQVGVGAAYQGIARDRQADGDGPWGQLHPFARRLEADPGLGERTRGAAQPGVLLGSELLRRRRLLRRRGLLRGGRPRLRRSARGGQGEEGHEQGERERLQPRSLVSARSRSRFTRACSRRTARRRLASWSRRRSSSFSRTSFGTSTGRPCSSCATKVR